MICASSTLRKFATSQRASSQVGVFFVGPGSEKTRKYDKWETDKSNSNWDRKSITDSCKKYKELGHQIVLGSTVFDLSRGLHQTKRLKNIISMSTRARRPSAQFADRVGKHSLHSLRRPRGTWMSCPSEPLARTRKTQKTELPPSTVEKAPNAERRSNDTKENKGSIWSESPGWRVG